MSKRQVIPDLWGPVGKKTLRTRSLRTSGLQAGGVIQE